MCPERRYLIKQNARIYTYWTLRPPPTTLWKLSFCNWFISTCSKLLASTLKVLVSIRLFVSNSVKWSSYELFVSLTETFYFPPLVLYSHDILKYFRVKQQKKLKIDN